MSSLYAAQRVSGLFDLLPVYLGKGSEKMTMSFTPGTARLFVEIKHATERL